MLMVMDYIMNILENYQNIKDKKVCLKLQGKKEYIQAVRGEEADTYIFRGEALKNVLEKDTVSGVLVLVSELTEAGQTVNYSGTKAVTWKLHDLSLSVKGKLPAGKKKIRF